MERHRVVVLGRDTFSRTSLTLAVWSRRLGWMDVTAKGIMRPRNNRMGDIPDEFDLSEIIVYRRANSLFSILVKCDTLLPGEPLRGDWLKYAMMSTIREFLSVVWRGYPADEADAWRIYGILAELLGAADRMDGLILGITGVMRILGVAGVAPHVGKCAVCGASSSTNGWTLSWKEGGTLCAACFKRDAISSSAGRARLAGTERESSVIDQGLVGMLGRAAREPIEALLPLRAPSPSRSASLLAALGVWCEAALDVRAGGFAWLGKLLKGVKS